MVIDEEICFVGEHLCNDYQSEIIQIINNSPTKNFYIVNNRMQETSDTLFEVALYRACCKRDYRILMISKRDIYDNGNPMIKSLRHSNIVMNAGSIRSSNLLLINGSQIICMPQNAKHNVHGLAVSMLIIDEIIDNDFYLFWQSLRPCVNLGGQIIVSSPRCNILDANMNLSFIKFDFRDKYKDCEGLS